MKIPTLINSSSKINGELIFTTDVRIDGEVFGKVESDKSVIIGAEGYVKGFLRASDLVVFGRFEGNIIVSGHTILHENASVFGNLYTKSFEVKDGAVLTARIVMYEELEAIDEAQIYLAEEMVKVEPLRRQAAAAVPDQVWISFDDTDYSLVQEKRHASHEGLSGGSSGDILSKIPENKPEDLLIYKPKAVLHFTDENSDLSIHSDPYVKVIDSPSTETAIFEDSIPVMAEQNETFHLLTAPETTPDPIYSESITETVEPSPNPDQPYESEKPIFLTSGVELVENQQSGSPETSGNLVSDKSEQNQNHTLEFDFADLNIHNSELFPFPSSNPVSIAGCMGEPVKEESMMLKKGKKKSSRSENQSITQSTRKSKSGHSLSGFEELRNLLIPVKFQHMKLAEKKSDQEKHSEKKIVDNDNNGKLKESEKNELFLNNAIRHLPDDDYSSLFN